MKNKLTHEEALKQKTERVYVQIMKKYSSEELTPELIRRNAERYHGVYTSMVIGGGEGLTILDVLGVRNAWKRVAEEKGLELDFSGRFVKIKNKEGICKHE